MSLPPGGGFLFSPAITDSSNPVLDPAELKKDYRQVEKDLPVFEDLEGAARALMRLQDVYALSVKGLVKGVFRRDGASGLADLYHPGQQFSLSADDCFHIGKVRTSALALGWLSPNLATAAPGMEQAWSTRGRCMGQDLPKSA